MSLGVGSQLGHYDVTALIGEGGMGLVYQATDTKLGRQVALKILPEAFTDDPDRLARFQREAKVLASLNHPNIGHIYGLEEAEGQKALVLELVEGPTLAERIKQGPIPVDEALPIAKQIAEALEAAHEQGIIHRDLKPANIKVREDGTVKVLDFGLAKALEPSPTGDPSQSPTLTAAATQMGVIMGTAAYMSPEQARGKPVDKRADVWSFGCVLYEMLTGRAAFEGGDISEVLAGVIKSEPNWEVLPANLLPALDVFLHRCMQKDARQHERPVTDAPICQDTPSGGLDDLLTSAEVGHDALVDLSREEAFQAADAVAFGPASGDASGDVVAGRLVELHPDDDGSIEGRVGVSVAASIEAVPPGGHPRRGRDRAGAAELREGGLRTNPVGVIAEDDQQLSRGVGAHTEALAEGR